MLGLRSAPRIYTHFADVALRIAVASDPGIWFNNSTRLAWHYIDDFFGGHSDKAFASRQFEALLNVFKGLNIPFSCDKVSAPNHWQVILGLLYDLSKAHVSLPDAKRKKYTEWLLRLRKQDKVTKRDLLRLVGRFRYSALVTFGGTAYVRHWEYQAHSVKHLSDKVALNEESLRDISFWLKQMPVLKVGMPFSFYNPSPLQKFMTICTDASGKFGMGGINCKGEYFSLKWSDLWPQARKVDIYFGELIAVLCALEIWHSNFNANRVRLFVDNENVETALTKFRAKYERRQLNVMLRDMIEQANRHKYQWQALRIPTEDNKFADALSRGYPLSGITQHTRYGIASATTRVPIKPSSLQKVKRSIEFWNSVYTNIKL